MPLGTGTTIGVDGVLFAIGAGADLIEYASRINGRVQQA
jgi:hypothetical protein